MGSRSAQRRSSGGVALADPPDAVSAEVADILADLRGVRALPDRLDRVSARFLGRPYLSFPLIGGPSTDEVLVTRIDQFDCVTYGESVLALATSRRLAQFPRRLADLRYLGGRIRWIDRNHYMSRWVARNVRAGLVARVLPHRWAWADPARELSVLPDYPVRTWRPRYLPNAALDELDVHAEPGDLVAFVSNKPDLDTFHVGLLVPRAGQPLAVRHAGRSAGAVLEQDLRDFLRANEVPGMLVVRPLWPSP
ncbi:MAG: DUF1460 domain-containing protein [Myxococcota bacterium]